MPAYSDCRGKEDINGCLSVPFVVYDMVAVLIKLNVAMTNTVAQLQINELVDYNCN